ncbi:MAG: hypothetical protein AAB631_03205 [Patescibacteria group bacterium]
MDDASTKSSAKVGLICIQFRFAKKKDVPQAIPWEPERPPTNKESIKGVEVFEMTENISVSDFLNQLEGIGFVMVGAWCRQMQDPKSKKYHFITRFMFAPENWATCSKNFVAERDVLRDAFEEICAAALWRVRGYINPLFVDKQVVPGKFAASINLEGRVSLFESNGTRVLRWKRDAGGNKIGDTALPLEPSGFLTVQDGQICLLVGPTTEVEV